MTLADVLNLPGAPGNIGHGSRLSFKITWSRLTAVSACDCSLPCPRAALTGPSPGPDQCRLGHGSGTRRRRTSSRDHAEFLYRSGTAERGSSFPDSRSMARVGARSRRSPGPLEIHSSSGTRTSPCGCSNTTSIIVTVSSVQRSVGPRDGLPLRLECSRKYLVR